MKSIFERPWLFALSCLLLIVFVAAVAVAVFFSALKGAEQTMVPDVRGKPLIESLLELQQKELYPRIEVRYASQTPVRGIVLEQDPIAGTIVKAGRRIRLVVSRGPEIDDADG